MYVYILSEIKIYYYYYYYYYTLQHYGAQPVVVFDDHDNSTSTKTADHIHSTVYMLQMSEKILAQIAWSR